MTETATATTSRREDALQAIQSGLRFEDSLRSRTEGLTWIVWGFATSAIFLSYQALNPLFYGPRAPFRSTDILERQVSPWWAGGVWVTWILLGALTTYALWRSAALGAPTRALRRPSSVLVSAAFVAFLFAGWGMALLVAPGRNYDVYPLLGMGTAWLLLGALNVYRATRVGRQTLLGIGSGVFLSAVLVATLLPTDWEIPWTATAGLWSALVSLVFPIAGGLWQTLRG